MLNVPEHDMFRSPNELLEDVYRRQEERIAYQAGPVAADATLEGAAG